MTPEQYWDDDYTLVIAYREAWKLRQQDKNYWLWLQGLYTHEAFGTVLSNAFAKKGTPPVKYLKEPIALTEAEIKERRERDERLAYESMLAEAKAWRERRNGINSKKEVSTDG